MVEHPGGTVFGRICRRLLLKRSAGAVAFSAAFLLADMLVTGCATRVGGRDVVAVRYTLSILYLPDSVSGSVHQILSAVLPKPDLSVLIDVDPPTAMSRVEGRGGTEEIFENPDDMARVRARMLAVPGVVVVDGTGDPCEVRDEILGIIRGTLLGRGPFRSRRPSP